MSAFKFIKLFQTDFQCLTPTLELIFLQQIDMQVYIFCYYERPVGPFQLHEFPISSS
jgi:hypothetical protein